VSAEDKLRYEITKCRNCEACKSLTDFSCLVFPKMFNLVDQERETGEKITTDQLMQLVNLCTFCAACPCLDIRAALMEAKIEYMDKHGLKFKIRAIEDVERIGKLGGAIPQFTNFLLRNDLARGVIENIVGIHRDRKIPGFPDESFPEWIKKRQRNIGPWAKGKKKVAYFAGCTARYLFPDVAKAVVEVFEKNGIEVYYLEQKCCGMPSLLEGDRKLTLEFARFNVEHLTQVVEEGYDIVCSCPTCGYMLKNVYKTGAYYAPECREPLKAVNDIVSIPTHGLMSSEYDQYFPMHAQLYEEMLRDEGYFSSINPKKRIMVAENTYDVGEYLRILHEKGKLDTRLGPVCSGATYYPPCHLREQRIGKPYQYLLNLIPGLSVDSIDGNYCCGNGGIMGFKQEFHHSSIKIASRLIAKIKSMNPEVLVTDCLSCRSQFNQLTSYKVLHPIQIIKESYSHYEEQSKRKAV
jgi:glycerol-3-phosphate dehydrogenase subunit C